MLWLILITEMYSNPKNLHIMETKVWFSVLNSSFSFYLSSLAVNWILISKIYNWIYILDLPINNKRLTHVFDGIKLKPWHILKNILCSLAQEKIPGNIPSEHRCCGKTVEGESFAKIYFLCKPNYIRLYT